MHNPLGFLADWIEDALKRIFGSEASDGGEVLSIGVDDTEYLGIGAATEHPLDRM